MITFTLYSRSYCHLCDDMRGALESAMQGVPHRIIMQDIDQDPELVRQYDELVPVLFGKKDQHQAKDNVSQEAGQQICHYHLDVQKLKAFIDE